MPRRDELLHEFDALSADSEEDVVRFRVAEGDLRHLTGADLPEVVEVAGGGHQPQYAHI